MNRLIRRTLMLWTAWRSAKQLRKAIPVIADLDRQEAEYRRAHKRGSARIIKARKQAVSAALAAGLGRSWSDRVGGV